MNDNKNRNCILIVDDAPENIFISQSYLKKEGYEILEAESGNEALEILETKQPDLILLDIMMPDLDGFETCQRIKATDATKDIPVIFLTAKNDAESITKAYKSGGVDYIRKPFNKSELLARVKTHLDLKISKEELVKEKETVSMTSHERKELIHILCHDLKNPVVNIKMMIALLSENPSLLPNSITLLNNATEMALDVIEMVKNVMALESGKIELELKKNNLNELVLKSKNILKNRFEEKNLTLHIEIAPDITVLVERVSFVNSVVNNLLTNAIKFSDPNTEIWVTAKIEENEIILTIKDNGIGIPEEMLDNIFKMNKVTRRLGTAKETGTGFGMPLVQKFVHSYGGKIEIVSKVKDKNVKSNEHGTHVILSLKTG